MGSGIVGWGIKQTEAFATALLWASGHGFGGPLGCGSTKS